MGDGRADEDDAVARTMQAFIAMSDAEAARRFAELHPELRDISVVADLVSAAKDDPHHAALYRARAQILCGSEWPEGPEIAASVLGCYAALDGSPEDRTLLTDAFVLTRSVVDLEVRRVAHPAMLPSLLWVSSLLLIHLYTMTNQRDRLDEALTTQRAAVAATPPRSAERLQQVNNLANILAESYAATGQMAFLEEALTLQRSVIDGLPPGVLERSESLSNLAARLLDFYKATSQPAFLEEAISVQRSATETADHNGDEYAGQLHNLAMVLSTAYEAIGQRRLLEEAVSAQRKAVDATSPHSPDRPGRLNNLAGHLADLYEINHQPDLLDEAVAVQRQAAAATPRDSVSYPLHLNSLANHLASLYETTADLRLLHEALSIQIDALANTHPDDPGRAGQQNNLALHLAELYTSTGKDGHLHNAITMTRAAIRATPKRNIEHHRRLNNLAVHLATQFQATGRREHIQEAVALAREVIARVPPDSPERLGYLCNLANFLSDLYRSTGHRAVLDEAWSLTRGLLPSSSPLDRVTLARTRAGLAHLGEDFDQAAQELTNALQVFEQELPHLYNDPVRLRDLAQQGDGLVGDLIVCHVRNGNPLEAIAVAEGKRIWRPSPSGVPANPPGAPMAVAWLAAGQWETAVISTVDHITYASRVVDLTRNEIRSAVVAALNAARDEDDAACRRTVEALCRLTSRIVAALPPTDRLLVIPVGICAMLPYPAAQDPRGGRLIDHTAVTLAPSLAWARAAHRPRPQGSSVGVFHPGGPADVPLDVARDRRLFESYVGGAVADSPTADVVLDLLHMDSPIGHFSCHGRYNQISPMDSQLRVETPLTIRSILDHGTAPWLVNLSACETAIPDMRAAEQLISFPTAFLLAGAAHVFATLWPVLDDDAVEINRSCYRALRLGVHPAESLRGAVLRLQSDSADDSFSAPDGSDAVAMISFRWALFVHYGSPW
jgi:hypothetical protein